MTDLIRSSIDMTATNIKCRIMPVSQKERNMDSMGIFTSGSMIGYFLPEYECDGETYEVEENDIIEDTKNDVRYRVTKILQKQHLNNEVVYIKASLQKI